MISIDPNDIPAQKLSAYLTSIIAPRPIALVSTISADGKANLSPFSYFNLVSTSPPYCIFSVVRRMRDGSSKHTLENVTEVAQCVVNICDHAMVQQQSLSSTEYKKGVNEFEKSGLNPMASELVRPFRVAESPAQLECTVDSIIPLGTGGGSGNLVVARIRRIHLRRDIIDHHGEVDQQRLALVARLGADWYCSVGPENLFRIQKPLHSLGIGVDRLPRHARLSSVLTGNQLGQLGNQPKLPSQLDITMMETRLPVREILERTTSGSPQRIHSLHQLASSHIDDGKIFDALTLLFVD